MDETTSAATALPRWQSHKKVWADKITGVSQSEDGGEIWHLSLCGGYTPVSDQLHSRVPEGMDPVGGYYVRYDDGFESWSPAKAFEEGYTRA